jgi:hypothetical protein
MITITKKIESLLERFSKEEKVSILKKAWDACCDGEVLPKVSFDPWDGYHDGDREAIEYDIVKAVIDNL